MATLPPANDNLKSWWKQFTVVQRMKKPEAEQEKHTVFGVPLRESLKYASVQISTANQNGDLYIWGYIPVVVAKCGLYLKEHATEVKGTFRISGSAKRMRDLQAVFETPPRYGKTLDWEKENYTTHDVASVFRRFLTQMPEPVIPHESYHSFRDALAKKPYVQDEVISTYKRLIRNMARANQYLLLYVLDLLSVFARKSDKNLMTSANLAVIFRPGLISHPSHEMAPEQHRLSQEVLEFLIAHQDWFMLDIPPPPQCDTIPSPLDGSPSSEDNLSPVTDDGWKLIERGKVRTIARRKTFSERGMREEGLTPQSYPATITATVIGEQPSATKHLDTVRESTVKYVDVPCERRDVNKPVVMRSQTMPIWRRSLIGKDISIGLVPEPHKVLKKRPGSGTRKDSYTAKT